MVRYERGNFKSGYCLLKDSKLILINNFLPVEGRVNCVIELISVLQLDLDNLTDKSRKLLWQLNQNETAPEINFTEDIQTD